MQEVYSGIQKLNQHWTQGAVEKIFWNCGEHADSDPAFGGKCNPSLTNNDGSLTDLGKAYGKLCEQPGITSNPVATS